MFFIMYNQYNIGVIKLPYTLVNRNNKEYKIQTIVRKGKINKNQYTQTLIILCKSRSIVKNIILR